jgi:hypothetical protein
MIERKLKQPATGQPKPSLTRHKELPPEERAKVMEILRGHTYEQAQPLVKEATGTHCLKGVLWRFFTWQAKEDARKASEDMAAQVDRFIRERHSDWPEEKLREAARTFFILESMKNYDPMSFVNVERARIQGENAQLQERRLDFEWEKLGAKMRVRSLECGMRSGGGGEYPTTDAKRDGDPSSSAVSPHPVPHPRGEGSALANFRNFRAITTQTSSGAGRGFYRADPTSREMTNDE